MSSATQVDMGAVSAALEGMAKPVTKGEGGDWRSPRQRRLELLYKFYRCTAYDERRVDWDGLPETGMEETAAISRQQALPPGFEDVGGQTLPIKFRRPSAPFALGKVIPRRFTGMLFGSKRHPKIIADDPKTEDWLAGFAETTRLWAQMSKARNLGGAVGSVALGFRFNAGVPVVEVHDARFATPELKDKTQHTVRRFEIRYQFKEDVQTEEGWEERAFWFRRVITEELDVVWPKVLVTDNEPQWERERFTAAKHGYGFCPIVWIQNQPVDEDIDGDPDLHGAYELTESIDHLNSQSKRGTLANCDPSMHIASDAEFDGIKKGSGTALQTEKGASINYLEMTGAGIETARKLRDDFVEQVCTVTQCMLDRNEGGPSRTAEETEHNYSAMVDQCDMLREQYGELGVKRLLSMVLRAARALMGEHVEADAAGVPQVVKRTIKLPKRVVKDARTGAVTWVERVLGEGEQLELRWPAYFTPTETEITASVNAAGTAVTFGILDKKHGVEHIAEHFDIENVPEVLDRIEQEQKAATGMGPMGEDATAEKVADRTLSGARTPLPNPAARALRRVVG